MGPGTDGSASVEEEDLAIKGRGYNVIAKENLFNNFIYLSNKGEPSQLTNNFEDLNRGQDATER
jgi:hypothetical protein